MKGLFNELRYGKKLMKACKAKREREKWKKPNMFGKSRFLKENQWCVGEKERDRARACE